MDVGLATTYSCPGPQRRPQRVAGIVDDVNAKKATTINVARLTALPVRPTAQVSCGKRELPTPMTAVSKNMSGMMLIERPWTGRGHGSRTTFKSVEDASARSCRPRFS